jgi:hypothetical protein
MQQRAGQKLVVMSTGNGSAVSQAALLLLACRHWAATKGHIEVGSSKPGEKGETQCQGWS